jgi:Dna[CI] antecedent, DciA
MRKIQTLLHHHDAFDAMSKEIQSRANLQQLWKTAAPSIIADNSHAHHLDNGQLVIYADSAIVANKIKLTQASLLTALQNLQNTAPLTRECKVTSISVKVQVKSQPSAPKKTPKTLSANAVSSLETCAKRLGDSPLAQKLKSLASKR